MTQIDRKVKTEEVFVHNLIEMNQFLFEQLEKEKERIITLQTQNYTYKQYVQQLKANQERVFQDTFSEMQNKVQDVRFETDKKVHIDRSTSMENSAVALNSRQQDSEINLSKAKIDGKKEPKRKKSKKDEFHISPGLSMLESVSEENIQQDSQENTPKDQLI